MTQPQPMTCAEVEEMAGLYVLDALEADHAQAVSEHLTSCPAAHEAYAELASTTSALASTVDQQQPPAGLRDRVLAAVAVTPQVPDARPHPAKPRPISGSRPGQTEATRTPLAALRGWPDSRRRYGPRSNQGMGRRRHRRRSHRGLPRGRRARRLASAPDRERRAAGLVARSSSCGRRPDGERRGAGGAARSRMAPALRCIPRW